MNSIRKIPFPKEFAAKCLSWGRRLFIPVALGFLVYSAYRAGDHLAPLLGAVSPRYLLLAWVCWFAAQWVGPLGSLAVMRILNLPLGYRELALISVLRLPAKYLPGGIWQSVARFAAYRRLEVSKADSLFILVAEHLIAVCVSAALGASVLLHIEGIAFLHGVIACVLIGALALLAVTALWILRTQGCTKKNLAGILMAILAAALFWTFAGASFCAYWAAAFGLQGSGVLRIASCYLLSWSAGFVALFAPQGIGVFEWVASHLLTSAWPVSVTVIAAASFRIVTMAGDLSAWAAGVAISRFRET